MVKKHVMLPVEEVDYSKVKYKHNIVIAPSFSGWALKLFVMLLQLPLIGSLVFSSLKKLNGLTQELRNTLIPESPMFRPEFPPQDPEPDVILMEDENTPIDRVGSALTCLPCYDAAYHRTGDSSPFLYWKIRDFARAYQSRLVTPSTVAEYVISGVEQFSNKTPPIPLLISFNAEDVRKQAEASTQRFTEGTPLSILDGIFMVVKDDIDCYPHPSTCGTTWYHKVHQVEKDAVCVSRLRSCGVIFIGKANMHELGLGVTGNNSNYGTTRNPHALDRYTGGSSSGPAALVALGLCSAALGTDAGGSLRIPSALCGVVGLKTTFGRTDVKGSICGIGTVEIIGAIAASVEDMMLVYATMSGSSPSDRISMNPPLPSIPNLSSSESLKTLKSLRLGKYTEWFNDVCSIDISDKCEDVLSQLSETHGCQIIEIVIPELHEMRTAHLVSTGSEFMSLLNPYSTYGKMIQYTPDSFVTLAMFQIFSASDYVSAQRLRRRIMHYHMDIFKKVDIIVTPTTGVTAPRIPPSSLLFGESNFKLAGNLMQFIIAANLLGLPAISVPVGHDKQGLPIGLQLIGRPWGEASILRLASAIEEVSAKYRRRPSTFFDILKEN